MKIIILGCGRVGSTLARAMFQDGNDITVIDLVSESFRRLGTKYKGHKVVGNGMDEDILKRAGICECEVFVAVTPGDNRNIMAAQIAKEVYGVKTVMCRMNDPNRAEAYKEMGIITFCGTTLFSGLMRDFITSGEWGIPRDYNAEYLAQNS